MSHQDPQPQFLKGSRFTRTQRMRAGCWLAFWAALASGCVKRATYEAAVADLTESREEANVLFREAETLRAEGKRLDAEAQRNRAELMDLKGANAELTHKVDDLMLLNAEFAERLKNAGQNVEQLASERGNLRQALATTRNEVAEWRKQQQVIGVREAQQRQLVTALTPLIEAKRIAIGVRLGLVVVTIPSDHVFDPGKTNVKATGRPTLVQIARALRSLAGRSFVVIAHTDAVQPAPGFSPHWQLTLSRSQSVTRELVAAGLPPERVSAAAHAEYEPLESNESEAGRSRNRRIEIVLAPLPDELVKPGGAPAPAAPAPPAAPAAPSAKP
jgi:chemotaxis protein MotB